MGRAQEALVVLARNWQNSPEHSGRWWRSFAGMVEAHTVLGNEPAAIIASIRQQRLLSPELGGPRWKRAIETVEQANLRKLETAVGQ
jgi:hypothetical protein